VTSLHMIDAALISIIHRTSIWCCAFWKLLVNVWHL